jgi:hypothetical protein
MKQKSPAKVISSVCCVPLGAYWVVVGIGRLSLPTLLAGLVMLVYFALQVRDYRRPRR